MYISHPDLKSLSANLKRINIGSKLNEPEFNYLLEENELDTLWIASQNQQLKIGKVGITHLNKFTSVYLISINFLYKLWDADKSNQSIKDMFNKIINIGITYFFEQSPYDHKYENIVFAIENLEIVTPATSEKVKNVLKLSKGRKLDNKNNSLKSDSDIKEKKYQVFISSTFLDLKEERQAAVEAILKKGHIPAGMELFGANNKSQWEVIKKWIDDSDIYMLILGGRYGSINDSTGISYTEMEYKYAIEKRKPFFALVLHEDYLFEKDMSIIKEYEIKTDKYKAFKTDVMKRMCEIPKNIDQIRLGVNALDTLIAENKDSLTGWIKG